MTPIAWLQRLGRVALLCSRMDCQAENFGQFQALLDRANPVKKLPAIIVFFEWNQRLLVMFLLYRSINTQYNVTDVCKLQKWKWWNMHWVKNLLFTLIPNICLTVFIWIKLIKWLRRVEKWVGRVEKWSWSLSFATGLPGNLHLLSEFAVLLLICCRFYSICSPNGWLGIYYLLHQIEANARDMLTTWPTPTVLVRLIWHCRLSYKPWTILDP